MFICVHHITHSFSNKGFFSFQFQLSFNSQQSGIQSIGRGLVWFPGSEGKTVAGTLSGGGSAVLQAKN